jgi:hypothetical protein
MNTKRLSGLLTATTLIGALVLGASPARAESIGAGPVQVGTTSEDTTYDTIAVSNGGAAHGDAVGISTTGYASGALVAISGTDCATGYELAGISGTGCARSDWMALSGTGASSSDWFAISGNQSHGRVAVSPAGAQTNLR